MTTDELESRLQAGSEIPSFEVKGRMAWNVASLAKDILALSNLQDGGTILIGVEDGTFARQGVDESLRQTYSAEKMRDQMAPYADPHVKFDVSFPTCLQRLTYVAIRVYSFSETPVICHKDSNDLRAGVIYYRNSNRRIESAPISNSHDMRQLLMLAASRIRTNLSAFGFEPISTRSKKLFDEELGDL